MTLLTSILLTGGQALQTREFLMAVTKNSPEKVSFKEEILNTLSRPGVPKATTCLLTDCFTAALGDAINTPILQVRRLKLQNIEFHSTQR